MAPMRSEIRSTEVCCIVGCPLENRSVLENRVGCGSIHRRQMSQPGNQSCLSPRLRNATRMLNTNSWAAAMILSGGGMSAPFLLQDHAGSEPVDGIASRRVSAAQDSDAMVLKDMASQP